MPPRMLHVVPHSHPYSCPLATAIRLYCPGQSSWTDTCKTLAYCCPLWVHRTVLGCAGGINGPWTWCRFDARFGWTRGGLLYPIFPRMRNWIAGRVVRFLGVQRGRFIWNCPRFLWLNGNSCLPLNSLKCLKLSHELHSRTWLSIDLKHLY